MNVEGKKHTCPECGLGFTATVDGAGENLELHFDQREPRKTDDERIAERIEELRAEWKREYEAERDSERPVEKESGIDLVI